METATTDKIFQHLESLEQKMIQRLEKQDAEIKINGETGAGTVEEIKRLEKSLDQAMSDLEGETKLSAALKTRLDELEAKMNRPGGMSEKDMEEFKSLGHRFVESDEFNEMVKESAKKSRKMMVGSFFPSVRDTQLIDQIKGITVASAGALTDILATMRLQEIYRNPEVVQRVRDLLPVFPTEASAIEYVRESGFTNNANMQVEGNPSDLKPESVLAFEQDSKTVRTIAHWIPVTNQLLADVRALRAYIDRRLIEGLKLKEDEQILYGDGTGAALSGILTDPDVQDYSWSDGTVGDTKVDAIRRAMTLARLAEYPVDGIVLHPNDWEDIELLKGTDDHYIWVTVPDGGVPRLWRVPVIDSTAIQEGDFLCGAFGMGAALWDREEAGVRITDSHEDYFVRNMTVILAEERLCLTVFRPEAFVHGIFDEAPSAAS